MPFFHRYLRERKKTSLFPVFHHIHWRWHVIRTIYNRNRRCYSWMRITQYEDNNDDYNSFDTIYFVVNEPRICYINGRNKIWAVESSLFLFSFACFFLLSSPYSFNFKVSTCFHFASDSLPLHHIEQKLVFTHFEWLLMSVRFYCSNLFAWQCFVCFYFVTISLSDPFQMKISTSMRSVTSLICFFVLCLFVSFFVRYFFHWYFFVFVTFSFLLLL